MAARKKVESGKPPQFAINSDAITITYEAAGTSEADITKNIAYWKDAIGGSAFAELIPGNPEVNHPSHYTSHPSGVECIDVVEWMNFNIGNAVKYLWRADEGKADPITELSKAAWYINREIELRKKLIAQNGTE